MDRLSTAVVTVLPRVWTNFLRVHHAGLREPSSVSGEQAMVRLLNPANSCYGIGVVNLLFSAPPFLQFLARAERDVIPGKGEFLAELRSLTELGSAEVH